MREELIEKAKEYSKIQDELDEVEDELTDLRHQMFGDDSEDTEERARELFSEVSQGSGNSSKSERLESLEEDQEELRRRRAEVEDVVREKLVDVRFPLDETIQADEAPPITFPYEEPIESNVLDAIADVLGDEMDNGDVKIGTEAITVDTDSVNEAIEAVENEVMSIRKRADGLLNVPDRVEEVRNRDEKVAAMMYVINEHDGDGLTKAEMEDAIGLERGDLRGQLYHVLDNDPYLKKPNGEVQLTATGEKVITRFVEKYDTPSLIKKRSTEGAEREEPEGDGAGEDQEEVTAYE